MAQFIPVVTAIGGGSATTGAVIIASAATAIGAGVISARQQRAAGRIAESQSKINAAAEGDAAREREIRRRRLLLRAVASRQAQAGAAGIAFSEGSPARLTQLDIDEAQRDLRVDTANTRQRQRGLRAQGRAARIQGKAKSTATLLDTVARTGLAVVR